MGLEFSGIWKRRERIEPEPMRNWTDNDWARGRNQSLIFLIRVEDEDLTRRIAEIQDKLAAFSCVEPFPKNYLHITVKSCGLLAKTKTYEDDIIIDDVPSVIRRANEVLRRCRSFEISIAKLNILPKVVFTEVHDNGKIGVINKDLQSIPKIGKAEFDYPNFLPHISITQFRNKRDFNKLVNCLEKLRNTRFGSVTVSAIELVVAHLYNSSRLPKLEDIFDFEFAP